MDLLVATKCLIIDNGTKLVSGNFKSLKVLLFRGSSISFIVAYTYISNCYMFPVDPHISWGTRYIRKKTGR